MTDAAAIAGKLTKAQRKAVLAALRFIDTEAGIMNGVPNEPDRAVDDPDNIAIELADAFDVPFDEDWPERVVDALQQQEWQNDDAKLDDVPGVGEGANG
jgi:hypothetical protein